MHDMSVQKEYEKMQNDMTHYMVTKGIEMWSKSFDMWIEWNNMWSNMTKAYMVKFLDTTKKQ
jgi:hypothetical protein